MNRERIIIIICIAIVVLFYLFQDNTAPVEQVALLKEPTVQSSDDITINAMQKTSKEVYSTTPDSFRKMVTSDNKENKGNQPK